MMLMIRFPPYLSSYHERQLSVSSRQVSAAHEVEVALAGGTASFVEGPDDKALTATSVASREDTGDAAGVFAVVGFHIATRIALNTEGI